VTISASSNGYPDTMTDADGVTDYDYDVLGRLTAVTRPDASTIYFGYDPNGNMTMLTRPTFAGRDDPANIRHSFGYNAVNRMNSYTTPDGYYQYVFKSERRLAEIIFPSSKFIDFEYDGCVSSLMYFALQFFNILICLLSILGQLDRQ